MQKNVPKYTPPWIRTVELWAETSKRDGVLRAVQRPAHVAVVRQPARRGVPPDAGAGGSTRPRDPPRARPRPARARLVHDGGARRPPGAPGPGRPRPRRRGEDERGQGGARLRARRRPVSAEEAAAATRAIAARAEALDPAIATTAFMKEDRGDKVFVDSTRVGGATVIAAYSPRARPGVPVSFPVGWDDLDEVTPADFTVHTALGPPRHGRPVAGADARSATLDCRPRRGRARHPRRTGAGDARGQAPRPCPAKLTNRRSMSLPAAAPPRPTGGAGATLAIARGHMTGGRRGPSHR